MPNRCAPKSRAVRSEKEALQVKVLTTEEQCRSLYDQVRLTEGVQKAYEELRRTQQVVVQQERLRALGQMASGVAHDINNALSPIVAYSELLLGTVPDLPEDARQYLQNHQSSPARTSPTSSPACGSFTAAAPTPNN